MANILDNKLREDLERLKKIRAHRGLRHYWGLRVSTYRIMTIRLPDRKPALRIPFRQLCVCLGLTLGWQSRETLTQILVLLVEQDFPMDVFTISSLTS